MKINDNITGIIFALIGSAIFIIGDSSYKYLGDTYAIYHIGFYGKLAATLFFLVYLWIKQQKFITYFPRLQLYRSIALTINFICVLYALKSMSLVEVVLIFYMSPFITAILSHFILKEPVGIHRIISIVVGFIGILIILRPGLVEFNPAAIIMFVGMSAYSYSNILSRKIGKSEPSINFTLLPTAFTTLAILPLVLLDPFWPPLDHLGIMAMGGTAGSIAILFISMAYVRTHAVTVSILNYTEIFWAGLFGYLIFGDVTNDPFTILGGIVIILSGIYLIRREHQINKNQLSSNQMSQS